MDTTNESYSESEEDSVKILDDHSYNLMEQDESNGYETEITLHSENEDEDDLEDLFKTTAIDSREETVKTYKYLCAMNKEENDKLRKISEVNKIKIMQLSTIIADLQKKIKIASVKKKT